ncbi:MAG: hydrolase 2, exosortase A system-associated [Burkholderiales bacterium]|nr:hydrolase 2, exosortase A system-associated [Burkholderiales bacterium]
MALHSGPEAFFLPRGDGQRLCLLHRPASGAPRAGLVYVHPFAEEMNKSRRMAARQSRALAEAGCMVLQIDLAGCGDSSGEFGDASWQAWVDDVVAACGWLRQHCDAPLWLWGLRAGALLASQAAQALPQPVQGLLMWQAPSSGKPLLQQFLRLASAGRLLEGDAKGLSADLRDRLARGETVDIAGYELPAAVANGLESATLRPPTNGGQLLWAELSTLVDATLSPAAERGLAAWRCAGWRVDTRLVQGPAFWQTTEIEDADALLGATCALIDGALALQPA